MPHKEWYKMIRHVYKDIKHKHTESTKNETTLATTNIGDTYSCDRNTQVHACTRTHAHMHTRTHAHTYTPTHTHAQTYTCMHTHAHTCTHLSHTHTCIHIRTRTHTHTQGEIIIWQYCRLDRLSILHGMRTSANLPSSFC